MHWHEVRAAWGCLGDRIQDQWPEMRALDLARIAGDKAKFTAYLAAAHDLTEAEAAEAIEIWLMRLQDDRHAA